MTMAQPTERHRRGIQSASLVFVSTLMVVVVALGLYTSTAEAPGATSSYIATPNTGVRGSGLGPINSFPASWNDRCGYLVSGNATTSGTNFGPDSPLVAANLTLGQVYSKIVSSSAFQALAAGRDWVTLDWGTGQQGLPGAMQTFVTADFLFVSGGVPDPDGYAQMTYFVGSGNVTGSVGWPQDSCVGRAGFRYGARLSAPTVTYAVGQPLGINFTFTNLTSASMTITARTSCLGNFTVIQGGIEAQSNGQRAPTYGPAVYHSAKHPGCAGPPLKVVLGPRQSYSQTLHWDQTNDNGSQVAPGDYWITGMETGYLGQTFPVSVVEGPIIVGNQTQG